MQEFGRSPVGFPSEGTGWQTYPRGIIHYTFAELLYYFVFFVCYYEAIVNIYFPKKQTTKLCNTPTVHSPREQTNKHWITPAPSNDYLLNTTGVLDKGGKHSRGVLACERQPNRAPSRCVQTSGTLFPINITSSSHHSLEAMQKYPD